MGSKEMRGGGGLKEKSNSNSRPEDLHNLTDIRYLFYSGSSLYSTYLGNLIYKYIYISISSFIPEMNIYTYNSKV